ncbi:MAG: hypothetical protein ABR991_10195 [Terracidiphilus sp.]|jgi:hypothetical protein
MDISTILQRSLPASTESLFDRIITLGWYDGITDGLVCGPSGSFAFRFDILAWGPSQDQRIFAFSPISIVVFNEVVSLLSQIEQPEWPYWNAIWPSDSEETKRLYQELVYILQNAEKPSFVIETESMFKTISGVRELCGDCFDLIPSQFSGYPHLDNYDYWHSYLGLSS